MVFFLMTKNSLKGDMNTRLVILSSVSVMLTGCVKHVDRSPKGDVSLLTSNELCRAAGYAYATGNSERFYAAVAEGKKRNANHTIGITGPECGTMSNLGALQAQQDAQENQLAQARFASGMQNLSNTLAQQQQMQIQQQAAFDANMQATQNNYQLQQLNNNISQLNNNLNN